MAVEKRRYKTKRGWVSRYYVVLNQTIDSNKDRIPLVKNKGFSTYKEAYEMDQRIHSPKKIVDLKRLTVQYVHEEYLSHLKREVDAGEKSVATLEKYERYIEAFLSIYKNYLIVSIDSNELLNFKYHILNIDKKAPYGAKYFQIGKLSQETHIIIKNQAQKLFEYAKNRGWLFDIPKFPVISKNTKFLDAVYLTDDQIERLLKYANSSQAIYIYVSIYLGGRRMETASLTKEHFDLSSGWVQLYHPEKSSARKVPRLIPIPDKMIELLNIMGDDQKIYPWKNEKIASREMRKLSIRSGVKVTPNILRHTFAVKLLSANISPLVVAKLMGHKTTNMIFKHYGNIMDSIKRDAINKVSILSIK